MVGKVIAYGDTRDQAIRRMRIALSEMVVARFMEGGTSIHYLENKLAGREDGGKK